MSNDVETPSCVIPCAENEPKINEEMRASTSNDIETPTIDTEHKPMPLDGLRGEDGLSEEVGVEMPSEVFELTESEGMTIGDSGTSVSYDTERSNSDPGNQTLPLDGVSGEDGVDLDEQSRKWVDEGLVRSSDVTTHIDPTLYPDYFDKFGSFVPITIPIYLTVYLDVEEHQCGMTMEGQELGDELQADSQPQ
jgi:hypothetical protein